MPQWLEDAIFYEIYPQTFFDTNADGIGDLNGVTAKLSYVKDLGFNAIWLNPCFDSPFLDAGYDVRDYKLVAPRYGTNEDLYNCFAKAHELGMHILLDLVPGHTSYQHAWFRESAKAEPNAYSNRYIWTDSAWNAPARYRFVVGMADRDANSMINFFSSQPALNYGFHEMDEPWQLPPTHPDCIATKEALKDIMTFWLDHGCDGFRVDMADSLVKNDDKKTETAKIWRSIRAMLDEKYPEAAIISEWSCPQRSLKAGFHADFYLDHEGHGYHSLFRNYDRKTKENKNFFSKAGKGDAFFFFSEYLKDYEKTKDIGYISFITGNHDTPRISRLLDPSELKISYAFLLTMPGVPFLYYGDEIGMKFVEGLNSREGGYSRTGTRTPMQWNSGRNKGFSEAAPDLLYLPVDGSKDAPDAQSQAEDPDSLLNTVKRLTALRHEQPDLHGNGPFETVYVKKNTYPIVYRRGSLLIAVNPSAKSADAPADAAGEMLFSIGDAPVYRGGILSMAPQSFAVYTQKAK